MCDFNKDDVLILAKTILEDCVYFYDSCDYRGQYECKYCNSKSYELNDFKHELDCPALVAQDIMTGN